MTTATVGYQVLPLRQLHESSVIRAAFLSIEDRDAIADRFLAKVDKHGPIVRAELGPCWLWTGSITPGGYGQFYLHGHLVQAHRVAWLIAEGEIPADHCVCHRCDVGRCVRHSHHFLGTKRINAIDMATKGRAHLQRDPAALSGDRHWSRRHPGRFAGDRNPSAKLTVEQVIDIRERFAAGATYRAIASTFGIGTGAVGFIVKGQHWPNAGGPMAEGRRMPGPRRSA